MVEDLEELDNVINYLAATVEEYIHRRKKIFSILGGNEADGCQIELTSSFFYQSAIE